MPLPATDNAEPAPSFLAHLMHKLNVISEAEGTRERAAEVLGVNPFSMRRWLTGETWPGKAQVKLIDQRYFMAWEKLQIYGHPQSRRGRRPSVGVPTGA